MNSPFMRLPWRSLVLVLLTACSSATDAGDLMEDESDAQVSCQRQAANALRFDCVVELDQSASVRFELSDALASGTRSITGSDVGTHHEITLWGLRPDRAYTWSAFADDKLIAEGTLQTAELPAGVAGIAFDVTGNDPVVEHPADGTATIVASHAVPVQCNIQGGAFRLPNGDMIATCAVQGKAYHYRRNGGDAPSFTFAPRCTIPGGADDAAPVPLARIAPFTF